MLYMIITAAAAAGCVYFAFRYITVICGLKKIEKELREAREDLTQNRVIHLPFPQRHLRSLLCCVNDILEGVRAQRRKYERRESEFQKQIENISHDLRTPLTVILGYLKYLKRSERKLIAENAALRDTVELLERKAETMKKLADQFYDYARLNAGDYEPELERVDVSRVLRESLTENYQILEQACLKVSCDLPEHPVWALAQTTALERIFSNLFQNAARYADTSLWIGIEEKENTVRLFFTNDTSTLTEADVPYLFERFYMQDDSRGQGGSGLGLAVAKKLAEEMKGSLSAEMTDDNKNENAVVRFLLKLKLY